MASNSFSKAFIWATVLWCTCLHGVIKEKLWDKPSLLMVLIR